MVLAPVLVPELLLPILVFLLRNGTALHLLARLPLHLLLVGDLVLLIPLLVLLLLILHQFLEHVRFL